jgi:hypothetical protein
LYKEIYGFGRKFEDVASVDFRPILDVLNVKGGNGGEKFILHDTGADKNGKPTGDKERVVILGSEKSLECLCEAKVWVTDGTFFLVKQTPFDQIVDINIFVSASSVHRHFLSY